MASIRICTRGNKLGSGLHLQIARLNLPAASLLPVSRDSSVSEQEHRNRALVRLREYSTAKGRVGGWLKRQLYGWLLVAGLSGGALVLVYSKMKSTVDELSWVERLYPANIAGKVAGGFGALSDWLKRSPPATGSSGVSVRGEGDEGSSSTASGNNSRGFTPERDRLLHSEIRELSSRLQAMEKENHELRVELAKSSGVDPSRIRTGKKSLIEMYTDILTLLTEFDARSSRKEGRFINTLPQVVVVGDQSAGKTSVLEMVAGARIFPRGGGEMMTRSPVMVTLCEGAQHTANFNDSNKEYDLTKEAELRALRAEVEARMKARVSGGKTVSSEPIAMTVRGPQLKRMVLVDLPGIISTMTTGMASSTREEIMKMCRQYMQNPNAIIMCIQDGAVDAERSIVTDLVSQMDPEGQRTIFVLTKVDMAERSGMKQDRMLSIIDGQLFPMKALGYFAVVTGRGSSSESIEDIQRYEREYFAKSKLFQNGMLRETQLSTRNMVTAVTDEFWKMVRESINDQALHFKTLRYNLEAEWRNRYPGGRTLDRDDLFELGKADILNEVASLQVLEPAKWEGILQENLWSEMSPRVLEIFLEASQGHSAGEFNTRADIELHKWADSEKLASLCASVGVESMFRELGTKLEGGGGGGGGGGGREKGKHLSLSQGGLREDVEQLSRREHSWDEQNINQLRYVQMSTLDDKEVPSDEQWRAAVRFMAASLQLEINSADAELQKLWGATGFYDRWFRWQSQSATQAERRAISEELSKFLAAEPTHPSKLFPDEVLTVQRVLKNRGHSVSEEEVKFMWRSVFNLHFLRQAEQQAHKCQRGFMLRKHSSEFACPEVEFFWRVEQVMKSSAHTLRVQMQDQVRLLEQQVKGILDAIATDGGRKRELIRGDAVDKAEQLKQVRMIQEKLDAFREALSSSQQQKRH